MNCSETRECLFAFLDNELEAPLSIELQRHIDGCADCAREAEIERTLHKQLVATMNAGPVAFDEEMVRSLCERESVVESLPVRRVSRRRPRRRVLATAAVLGVAVGAAAWLADRHGAATASHGTFVDLVVADFEHFLKGGGEVQVTSHDRKLVASWLFKKTSLRLDLPVANEPEVTLVGGRKCTINGKPAAFAVYNVKGQPASLVAVDADRANLDTMTEVRHNGSVHWVDHCKGYTIVACRRRPVVYAVVSALSEEELLSLMALPAHPVD